MNVTSNFKRPSSLNLTKNLKAMSKKKPNPKKVKVKSQDSKPPKPPRDPGA